MKTFKLDETGDINFDSLHEIEMIDDLEEVKQRLKLSLRTNQGEWFLNQDFGVPWIDMLSESVEEERFRKEILLILNDDPAVENVKEITLDFDRGDRKSEINFIVLIDDERFEGSVVI